MARARIIRLLLEGIVILGVAIAAGFDAWSEPDPIAMRLDVVVLLLALMLLQLTVLGEYTRIVADRKIDTIAANTREIQARTSAHLEAIGRERSGFERLVAEFAQRTRQVH
jgi:predicted signal transduction protein with EAL and GGDEF domain